MLHISGRIMYRGKKVFSRVQNELECHIGKEIKTIGHIGKKFFSVSNKEHDFKRVSNKEFSLVSIHKLVLVCTVKCLLEISSSLQYSLRCYGGDTWFYIVISLSSVSESSSSQVTVTSQNIIIHAQQTMLPKNLNQEAFLLHH